MPEDQVTKAKRKKMERAAQLFAGGSSKLIDDRKGWRIDVVAIILDDPPTIRHYENI
jgi:Holliday junction resolvase-like predicted endonuclease